MKTLLLMRHAKSSWEELGLAPRMGRLIERQDLVPDLILSSTARRARKTARLVAKHCGFEGEITLRDELYHAAPTAFVSVLNAQGSDADRVLLVGHNPGMEAFLWALTDSEEAMPTAALAQVSLDIAHWGELSVASAAELVHLWKPRELTEE